MKKAFFYILLLSLITVGLPYASVKFSVGKTVVTVYDSATDSTFEAELEDYVACAVAGEMMSSFEEEALKAQAVASRTYAVKKMNSGSDASHNGAALCTDSGHCQAYADIGALNENERKKILSAVSKTKGKILVFDGEPISALFHSASYEKTENAADVWGNDVEYLKSVETPEADEFNSTAVFTYEQIESALSVSVPPTVEQTVLTEGGGVKEITIGGKTFAGTLLRSLLGLKSTRFTVEDDGASLIFSVKGNGHGVGMSQWGANKMAENGANYKKILTHYYSGKTTLSKIPVR